jgi:type I restriction-modification system DNA methylase subunit
MTPCSPSTQIPVCLWFLARDKKNSRFKDRRGKVLFIDARELGTLIDRVHRDLSDDDIQKIADTYHTWRGDSPAIWEPNPTMSPSIRFSATERAASNRVTPSLTLPARAEKTSPYLIGKP